LCSIAAQKGFLLPRGFENKSFAWLRRQYNGIGAEWMPARLRNLVTKLFSKMEAAALIHDVEYLNPNKSYWNFTKANFRLFYNGIKSSCIFSGFSLFVICQLFGWSAWKEGKETMAWHYYFKEETE
jgi:hypothetical protein